MSNTNEQALLIQSLLKEMNNEALNFPNAKTNINSKKINKYSDNQPLSNKIIDNLGGNDVVAKACGISLAAVSYWRKNGIPQLRLLQLQTKFKGI